MRRRKLGASDLEISEISLGTWRLLKKQAPQAKFSRVIREAFRCGVNFFDTADVYKHGRCEDALGIALKGLPRAEIIVGTKVGGGTLSSSNEGKLRRVRLERALNDSLRRLRTDYIDLYQLHCPDPETSIESILETLDKFVRQGKVRFIGFSHFSPHLVTLANEISDHFLWSKFISQQKAYNILSSDFECQQMAAFQNMGIGTIAYNVFGGGDLLELKSSVRADISRDRLMRNGLARIQNLHNVAKELGVSAYRLAIQYVLQQPSVSSALIGVGNLEQLGEILQGLELSVTVIRDALQCMEVQPGHSTAH